MYQRIFRPLLFRFDPEKVHDLTIQLLRIAGQLPHVSKLIETTLNAHSHYNKNINKTTIFSLKFPNRIGLAAGYDKNALALRGLARLGFGHIEIGTVTPVAQNGNPKPRVFRIPEENAVINRMGFPGKGADFVVNQLSAFRKTESLPIIGVNIGKNKDTPNEEAAKDYLILLEKFSTLADYITINVSSPNTAGLRRLQAREYLEDLLKQLAKKRSTLENQLPILIKIAPDISDEELDDAIKAVITTGMNGVIATNTTIYRPTISSKVGTEAGGLSGKPLQKLSLTMVEKISKSTSGRLPIIGVGGIMGPEDAQAMIDAGASLIQIYTGLVYKGPGVVREIIEAI